MAVNRKLVEDRLDEPAEPVRRLTAIGMITVPPTVGVISRQKNDNRAENRNCTIDETTTRVASSDSPPADTPMNAPDVPM